MGGEPTFAEAMMKGEVAPIADLSALTPKRVNWTHSHLKPSPRR
jgi:hypothetical protein